MLPKVITPHSTPSKEANSCLQHQQKQHQQKQPQWQKPLTVHLSFGPLN